MRAIELKNLILATFSRADGTELSKDVEYDPKTMIQRTFDYRLNIKGIMSVPMQGDDPRVQAVANIDDIRKSVKILQALADTKEGEPLVLEDIDYSYLDARIAAAKWPFIDAAILTFVDDIHNTKALSKERIADAVASAQEPHRVEAADPTGLPVSLIDAKASRNGKQKDHAKR